MRSNNETKLVKDILRKFGSRPDLRIWRNNTGVAKRGPAFVRFGVPGQADISGILGPSGRRVEIECKVTTQQTDQQRHFQAMIESLGGIYILARSVEDVALGLAAATKGGELERDHKR